jgi:hypothetical protein
VRQHEDRLGTYESIDTQHIDAGVWRPEDTDAVFVRQGDSVTYVGPDVEAETRPADIRNQSVSLFVDQLSRRSLQINGTTTVRGSPAVTVDGNASVVPGSKIDEPEPVDDVQVNGVITDEMVVQEAQVQYERPYTTNEPTVTRRYEVVSMGQGITEPEWIHDAPQISAEKITPHEVRLRNTGERPIPVGSYITIQYDDTRLSIPLETQIDSGETVRIHRPPEESDDDSNPLLRDNEDSTTPPPLRVSSSSVDSEQARSLPDDVIVSVRVGDDAAQVEAS